MPSGRFYGKRRRGVGHGTRKRRNATERTAATAKHRTSAKAQAKQITTLARATTHIQRQLKDNQNVDMMWQCKWANRKLCTRDITTLGNVIVLPLTSGPTGNLPENGAYSNLPFLNAVPTNRDMAWEVVQPKGRSVQDGRGAAPWCKMFRQNVKMAFHSNTLTSQCRYTLYVVRLARAEDGSTLDNTMLQRLGNIDGSATGPGFPASASDFAEGEDFYAIQGFLNPVGQTNTAVQGVTISDGLLLPRMNSNRYKVLHRREFVLGPARANNIPQVTQTSQAITQVGAVTPDNTSFYQCEFSINYGGAIVKPSNEDAPATATDPQTLNDYSYLKLNPKLKHWCLLFPSKTCLEVDAAPPTYQQGVPVVSMQSTISTKCPA